MLEVETPQPFIDPVLLPKSVAIFEDVDVNAWYRAAIQRVFRENIMKGTGANLFSPMEKVTRGQFVTVLYNMNGFTKMTFEDDIFVDVKSSEYYALPVVWAAKNRITSGVGNGLFNPGAEISREQLLVMLYSYAKFCDQNVMVKWGALENYADCNKVSYWAKDAMQWAVTHGIISGRLGTGSEKLLDPTGQATRAECAQIIVNYRNCYPK